MPPSIQGLHMRTRIYHIAHWRLAATAVHDDLPLRKTFTERLFEQEVHPKGWIVVAFAGFPIKLRVSEKHPQPNLGRGMQALAERDIPIVRTNEPTHRPLSGSGPKAFLLKDESSLLNLSR